MCILGDGLYCVEPLMKMCSDNWKYIFNLKEGTQTNIVKDYRWLGEGDAVKTITGIGKEDGTGRYLKHIEETTGKTEIFNVFEYEYTKTEDGKEIYFRFIWATNIEIKDRNLEELIMSGRKRWKIENEDFNNQKNGIYKIENMNSRNTNAMKNHYLLTQVVDILMQLYLAYNKLVKTIGQSINNTSSRLLKSFRGQPITNGDVLHISTYTTVHLE